MRGEVAALDELHRVEVAALVSADFVDRDDVRMVEIGGGFRLGGESLHFGLGREDAAEDHLQSDGSADGDLACFEDDAHAALGDALDQFVVADALFDFGFFGLAHPFAEEAARTEAGRRIERGGAAGAGGGHEGHGKWTNGKWQMEKRAFHHVFHLPFAICHFLLRQRGEKVTDFFVDFGGGMDRVADFETQQVLVALAEAVNSGFERGFGHVEGRRGLGVAFVAFAPQIRLDGVEEFFLVAGAALGAELIQDVFDQHQGPAAVEDFFRGELVRGFEFVAALGVVRVEVEVEVLLAAAALLRRCAVVLVGEEMFHAAEQPGAESPAGRVDGFQIVLLEHF